jgi:hypothetical protein
LDDLYGTAVLTKSGHLEALAGHALARSESSDPYFLLGVFLTYDNQQGRAEKFFDRAADLAGISGGHIAAFEPATFESAGSPAVASVPSFDPPKAETPVAIAALETEI